ncbi:MAG TPA: 16S rRNA (guanine(527)-N(7))-methyltransferase RsmG [Micromonosporaceae bacterium]|jgi:16S rRNA (guanine527-N7)-methyltransferase
MASRERLMTVAGATPERRTPPDDVGPAAVAFFGDRLPVAISYATMLATDGVVRGLIGPREADRIWDRHLLNSVAIEPSLPRDAYVIDVGSGAGLPGLALAIARPDVRVVLVEPLLRRTTFLSEVVEALGLGAAVTVVRARAEDVAARPAMFHVKPADVATARAVASLDRLAAWCLPLLRVGGRLLALKGASAAEEIAAHRDAVTRLGGGAPTIHGYGVGLLAEPTTVIEVVLERGPAASAEVRRNGRRRR